MAANSKISLAARVHYLTSVVQIPKRCIYKLPEVSGLLCDIHQQRDGVVLTAVKVHQCFRQTRLPRGWLW